MSALPSTRNHRSALRMLARTLLATLVVAATLGGSAQARPRDDAPGRIDFGGVIGMREDYLSAAFWTARLRRPDRVVLTPIAIARQNSLMMRIDPSMRDLRELPSSLDRDEVARWIEHAAARPPAPLFDASGTLVAPAALDRIIDNRGLDAIPATERMRFGLVVRRAALRTYPTDLRVFNTPGDTDIDRFQETALFPGTPVAIVHSSRDGEWWYVISPRYAAWIRKQYVAEGPKAVIFDFVDTAPARVVTGAQVRTAFTPEAPRVSGLPLDMGVRLPLLDSSESTVNGQNPYSSWTIGLPVRNADGSLTIARALLPRNADTQPRYLTLTRAHLIEQAFKFLGERYGWGDDYDTRDCSGFVAEVYQSMGVALPRNTGAQARSPALDRLHLDAGAGSAARLGALRKLEVGDLVYVPGHVMLVIGRIGDETYVIHDIHDGKYMGIDRRLHSMHLNAVSVTPLSPLRFDTGEAFVDRITDIVRIRGAVPGVPR